MKWLVCLVVLMCMIHTIGDEFKSKVYQCSDKQANPPDVQAQCKRLTRGQWWNK